MKKLLALILAAVMLFSVMSFAVAEEESNDELFRLSVMLPDFYSDKEWMTYEDGNPVLQEIAEKTGVILDIQWIANSVYGDNLSYTLANPDDMPMLMVFTGARDPIVIQNARAGAFWDLTDLIPSYENLAAGAQAIYDGISIDGRVYGIYRARNMARAGIYYRADVAAELGITEEPATMEDLTNLAMALATKSDNTYCLSMCKYVAGTINIITVAFGAPNTWGIDENGDVYPAHQSEDYLKGLNWLRDLYAAGGIDPNFIEIESGNWNDAERNSQAFMRFDCLDNCYRQQEWFDTNKPEEGAQWAMLPGVVNEYGNISVWPQNAGHSGVVTITKAVKDEDTVKKILSFLDWCNTPEGCTLINWGMEGETFWVREDGYRYTNPEEGVDMSEQVYKIQHSLNQLGTNVDGDKTPYLAKTTDLRSEYNEISYNFEYIVANPCITLDSETAVQNGTILAQTLEDAAVQYIMGIIDEDALRTVWAQWSADGGDKMTAEYNAAYHAAFD